jgi:hypothetical protein
MSKFCGTKIGIIEHVPGVVAFLTELKIATFKLTAQF